jgi:hypothetical protein
VDETRYDNSCIQDVFKLIERSAISPQELARMKEEYNQEEAQHNKYLAGREESKLAIATTMLKEGLAHDFIHKMTGVSLTILSDIVTHQENNNGSK